MKRDLLSVHPDAPAAEESAGRSQSIEVFQQIINGLPEQIALLDVDWNILAVNDAWIKTAALYGFFELQPGTNYYEFCEAQAAKGHPSAGIVAVGIREVGAGIRDSFRFVYHGSDRWEGFSFQLCVNRLEIAGQTFATVTRYNITELLELRKLREGFSHSLIEGQAEERRRIARELHDSTMQLLVALGLSLGQIKRARKHEVTVDVVAEMELLLGEAQRELRSISYLAHPPLLEEKGLADALKGLVEGFGRRTQLPVSLRVQGNVDVPWRPAEVAFYRMVQEALSNIHRHAHATEASVTLCRRKGMIHAVVADNGIGMPTQVRYGVGLPGMRERLNELGGRLTVLRASPGTMLIASLPLKSRIRAVGDLAVPG